MSLVGYRSLVDDYLALWNMPDADRRRRIDELFTEDPVYNDPTVSIRGRADLDAYIGLTRKRFGELPIGGGNLLDGHHRQVRFDWRCGRPDSEPVLTGLDIALLDGGRITAVYGFFD